MKPKFKVGETVTYDRGEAAKEVGLPRFISVHIQGVTTEYREGDFVYKYAEPLYRITWFPRGRFDAALESQLQRTE